MATATFYISNSSSQMTRLQTACKIAEKAYKAKHTLYIHCASLTQANQIDQLLWTYKDQSFIPHDVISTSSSELLPVQIGYNAIPEKKHDIIINLTDSIIDVNCNKIIEIVINDNTQKKLSRQNYTAYKNKGYKLETHNIS